ncbi:hypothetical protein MPTK1_3g09250 [Marchantia polymorpha subsp. ruderalis]|uniref:Uncharacterized protein n=2 Tax=Marchantia polymorpha TaxID=3197 RepID=A0AAF6AYZ4_MARPO|nr:hypothetical protein MARPO_0085s0104 [Marchantia polymorpha]BBN04978.1 hypothetical protein Mp_3g09250 [Marchantia polymorpha subsp. ruderalis]|eukprot:PTQ33901.1 hypothetical protein MARPO_0085s0104 [Marchantia polymorpha]
MSSGQHADSLKLSQRDLKRPGETELPGAPIVHVENVEQVQPGLTGSGKKSVEAPKHHHQSPPITHETENVKTTVTEEDDSDMKTSFVDKMKGKVSQIGDKLRPNNAVHAKEEDPHPSVM